MKEPNQHMNPTKRRGAGLYYGMYILAMLIFGTNGLLVAHMSIASSQIVLLRTLIGGLLLTCIVLLHDRSGCCSAASHWD